jgi:xanthine dehydrogenase YagS FAD-binding subunit
MKAFEYAQATNLDGAMAALAKGYAPKANGVDLLDRLKEGIEPGGKFVSIHRVPELKGISEEVGHLRIGALATLAEISGSAAVRSWCAAVAESVLEAATPQIRARASVGGNLLQRPRCWYYRSAEHECRRKGGEVCFAANGDNNYHALFAGGSCPVVHPSSLAPALVAADAVIVIRATDGKTREARSATFFAAWPGPGGDALQAGQRELSASMRLDELITELRLPKKTRRSAYVEFKEKQSFDWPLASAAVVQHEDGRWSVVLGHVAPTPWRAAESERVLGSAADVTPELAEQAADAALAGASPLTENRWRLRHVRAAVRRALLQACGKEVV